MNRSRQLAIGLDAAESKLVRQLIDDGDMPCLRSLLADGHWIRLESTADVGSSSVWPTFTTGEDPRAHGIYSEWCWESELMAISPLTGRHLRPFWEKVAAADRSVGVLGVPFMPFVGSPRGFEISERPPYLSPMNGHPPRPSRSAARRALSHGVVKVSRPEDLRNLRKLAADAFAGLKLRGQLAHELLRNNQPDLAIIVFTELHEVSHCLWRTIESQHPLFKEDSLTRLSEIRPSLRELFQEADRQIANLIDAMGSDTSVMVFSLHGMTAGRGAPTFLTPLMQQAGFSRLAQPATQGWNDRAIHALRNFKKRTPQPVKNLYYRALSRERVRGLAVSTLLPQYDWSATRAFPIVEEHLSSIRINLRGREAKGIVVPRDYESSISELERWLGGLRSHQGDALAKKIVRTATNGDDALNSKLPDIVIHWEDDAFASRLRVNGFKGEFPRDGDRHLSQHTNEGFCILGGDFGVASDCALPLKGLSELILRRAVA